MAHHAHAGEPGEEAHELGRHVAGAVQRRPDARARDRHVRLGPADELAPRGLVAVAHDRRRADGRAQEGRERLGHHGLEAEGLDRHVDAGEARDLARLSAGGVDDDAGRDSPRSVATARTAPPVTLDPGHRRVGVDLDAHAAPPPARTPTGSRRDGRSRRRAGRRRRRPCPGRWPGTGRRPRRDRAARRAARAPAAARRCARTPRAAASVEASTQVPGLGEEDVEVELRGERLPALGGCRRRARSTRRWRRPSGSSRRCARWPRRPGRRPRGRRCGRSAASPARRRAPPPAGRRRR